MSQEKIDLLRAYGAEVVVGPTDVAPDSPRVLLPRRRPAHRGDPGRLPAQPVLQPGQPGRRTTRRPGPSCGARPAARSPTSSSASAPAARSPASARYLKEQNPTIEVDRRRPGGLDLLRRRRSHPYLVEGVGEDFWPETFDPIVVDRYVHGHRPRLVPDHAPAGARPRASSPAARAGSRVHAALEVAREIDDPEAMIVVILPDGGRALPVEGLQRRVDAPARLPRAHRRPAPSATCCAQARGGRDPAAASPSQTHDQVRDAIALLHEHRVSQLPVVSARRPARRRRLDRRARAAAGARSTTRRCSAAEIVDVMEPPFPAVSRRRPRARGGRAAGRRPPGAARHRATAAPVGHRHARRPARSRSSR